MANKEIYVVRKKSEKKGTVYTNMYIDLGYQEVSISMDVGLIAQLCNWTHEQVCSLELDKKILVGTFTRKEGK